MDSRHSSDKSAWLYLLAMRLLRRRSSHSETLDSHCEKEALAIGLGQRNSMNSCKIFPAITVCISENMAPRENTSADLLRGSWIITSGAEYMAVKAIGPSVLISASEE